VLVTTQEKFAFMAFERTFKEFGLPHVIRTDNGVPFASAHALYGLIKLAVWRLRLRIQLERIKPEHTQQNGRHERMRLTPEAGSDETGTARVSGPRGTDYPFHDHTIMVTGCGRSCFRGLKVNLGHVFAGQSVGVTQVGERIWLVTLMQYDLG
jgi:putative transposase